MDASLGFATVDDARRSIAPHLRSMGAGQLNGLADGLQHALQTRPELKQTFKHKKENMLRAVQVVQDSFLKGEFSDLKKGLGADIRDSVVACRTCGINRRPSRPLVRGLRRRGQ